MVLHNDKWKYKAKKAVERKHAAQGKKNNAGAKTDVPSLGADVGLERTGGESSGGEDDDAEASTPAKEDSNSWRFADPVVDETILKDPEYIARLEAIRQEEEDRVNYMRNAVSDKLRDGHIQDTSRLLTGAEKQKSLKTLRDGDLKYWNMEGELEDDDDDDDDDDDVDEEECSVPTGPEIREFTPQEKAKFLALQDRIRHQKEVDRLKSKFERLNGRGVSRGGKVLELNSTVGKDNYKPLVDDRLRQMQQRPASPDTDELDGLVQEMLGVELKDGDKHSQQCVPEFDLDSLLMSKSPQSADSASSKPAQTRNVVSLVLDQDQDDFLDSIL